MSTLIDPEMAAVVLGCSARRVRQLVAAGALVNYGEPRRIRLDLAEVSRYAARASVTSADP